MDMPKVDYSIEHTWKAGKHLITVVVLCKANHDNDLIGISDEIYDTYITVYEDVEIYFFTSSAAATNYVYVRLVQKSVEDQVVKDLGCVGSLANGKLFGYMSPPKLLKTYSVKSSLKSN